MRYATPAVCFATALLLSASTAFSDDDAPAPGTRRDLTGTAIKNKTAYVPPQCYTETQMADGGAANPCYSCHTQGEKPNFVGAPELQLNYDFANPMRTAEVRNPWHNLFKDRSAAVAKMSDAEILAYVRGDNYRGPNGDITLARELNKPPAGWDPNHDGRWAGYVPDVYFSFDDEGFDRGPKGHYSGWRAYIYTPLPGSFLPSNGAFDDVLIRLPAAFRERKDGAFDRQTYVLNLAIAGSLIKKHDIAIDAVDERHYRVDLDRNGRLGTATKITYDWAPLEGRNMSWVGRARSEHARLAAGLFPKGTEFIHTLRYLDVDDGQVVRGRRMKELRYARKQGWLTYSDLRQNAFHTMKEAHDFPDRGEMFRGDVEHGLNNGQGWVYQGFIEDRSGALRPQTVAETTSCMGCHGGVGRTTDTTFSFARKLNSHGPHRGWTGWNQRPVASLPEPSLTDGRPEYATYLRENHAGDEFRSNNELIKRFFGPDGRVNESALAGLKRNIGLLLLPSPGRALALDKGYRALVAEQSFLEGRAAHVKPMENVHRRVKAGSPTGIDKPFIVEHAGEAAR